MTHRARIAFLAGICGLPVVAEDLHLPQFHGFATEGFTYSNDNNYLGVNTSSGSFDWTEAALNANEQLNDNFRIGAQVHLTKLGEFGRWGPTFDWALIDYQIKPWAGLRAGKVKIRWGLYNDTQDADPGYLWSLLPEPMYAADWRATDLSQYGGELYGRFHLPGRTGELGYSAYYGYFYYASNDGNMEGFRELGYYFSKIPGGITPGFDLRWKTPLKGLTLGGSLMLYNAHGSLIDNGTFRQPLTFWPAYYGQYEFGKFFASAQYMKLVQYTDVSLHGAAPVSSLTDNRAWFAMAGYHVTNQLQLGVYWARNIIASAPHPSEPGNYFRDWVVSGRYDFNSFLYAKVEGHFIDGAGLGFYGFDNPNGLKPQTILAVVKLGFCF
ncbi:MAG TPA: hypothetical protein VFW44_14015 [Bryobacteraceae bacterium]|nr:hypothetical protein [Bryobacteraceae bacterium]